MTFCSRSRRRRTAWSPSSSGARQASYRCTGSSSSASPKTPRRTPRQRGAARAGFEPTRSIHPCRVVPGSSRESAVRGSSAQGLHLHRAIHHPRLDEHSRRKARKPKEPAQPLVLDLLCLALGHGRVPLHLEPGPLPRLLSANRRLSATSHDREGKWALTRAFLQDRPSPPCRSAARLPVS